MNTYDVIIVGAGGAGLMAARELSKAGKKMLVLEARDRIGGRIYPLPASDWGYEAQGGGEFIHGAAPITRSLIKEAGLTLTHPVEWWSVLDGKPRVNEQVSPHDPELEAKLKELTEDLPVTAFLDTYFMGAQYAALRDQVIRRVEGYEAADPTRFSTFGLRSEVVEEEEWQQNNIKEGYGALLRYLAKDLNIQLQKEVVKIETGDTVVITCKDSSRWEAQRAIVTVPLPILSKITFIPAIPQKLEAVSKIGFGAVIKILLRFKTKWWATPEREANFERMFFMFSNEEVSTWWTQHPEPHLTLTGWVGGPKARVMAKFSDQEILEKALKSLSNIFKISVEELKQELMISKISDWVDDEYAGGAYSYATPESAEAIKELQKPVANKLYFAGEAINEEGSLVESALQSGLHAAKQILQS